MYKFISISAIFLMIFFINACCSIPKTYEGQVIDADTKEPIEGVLIWADWSTEKGGLAGTHECSRF